MGTLRMASIFAACIGMTVLFFNFTPLALPVEAADTDMSEVVAKALGAAMTMAQPSNPYWKLDSKNGCTNDLVETNAVHVKTEKGSLRVTMATGIPVRCGHPISLKNVTVQSHVEGELRQPSSLASALNNFDGAILPASGTSVHYDGDSSISQISLAQEVNDHSVFGSVHVSDDGRRNRIEDAQFTIYQNTLHVVGKSRLKDIVFNDSCCTPVSGSITTQMSAGQTVAPTDAGAALVGKNETLTFDGCGSAQLRDSLGHRSHIPVQCM